MRADEALAINSKAIDYDDLQAIVDELEQELDDYAIDILTMFESNR
jgi:hypothetical protein